MLNVVRYECQMRASEKLKQSEGKFHLVFDEVGTGKTVVALYCIRNVLLKKGMDSKILIICPNLHMKVERYISNDEIPEMDKKFIKE